MSTISELHSRLELAEAELAQCRAENERLKKDVEFWKGEYETMRDRAF